MIIVALILLIFLLHGVKFHHPCNPSIATRRATTEAIKGLFIVLVFFRHASQYVWNSGGSFAIPWDSLYFYGDSILEQWIVVMFLFYSGYGVIYGCMNKGEAYIKNFGVKRILPVYLNFALAVLIFVVAGLALGKAITIKKAILSFLAWDSVGNSNWYIFDILVCYACTWFCFHIGCSDCWTGHKLIILTSLIGGCEIMLYLTKEAHWFNTILCYALGACFATYEDVLGVTIRRSWQMLMFIAVAFLVAARCLQVHVLGLFDNLGAATFAVLMVVLTSFFEIASPVLSWFGRMLFPLYIYQRLPMLIIFSLRPDFVRDHYMWFFAISGMVTLLIAATYDYIRLDGKMLVRVFHHFRNMISYAAKYGMLSSVRKELNKDYIPIGVSCWQRMVVDSYLKIGNDVDDVVIVLTFSLGGGAASYLTHQMQNQSDREQAFVVRQVYAKNALHVEVWRHGAIQNNFYIRKLNDISRITNNLGRRTKIVVNELFLWNYYLGNPRMSNSTLKTIVDEIVSLRDKIGAELVFLAHDYFCICPRITMLTPKYEFCDSAPNDSKCEKCIHSASSEPLCFDDTVDIVFWRKDMSRLINSATEVRTFSDDTYNRLRDYFPSARLTVVPHSNIYAFNKKPNMMRNGIVIGIFGEISRTKGADKVAALSTYLKENGLLDVRIVIVGVTTLNIALYSNISCIGRYRQAELPGIIESNGINISLFPSVWPETFSYVIQELMALDMPVVCYGLGAPKDRIRQYKKGIVAKGMSPEQTWEAISDLYRLCYSHG